MGEHDALYWLNLILAALASFAAFGSFQKMQWGTTRPCIIGAVLLIALGTAGQWLGHWFDEWVRVADTALYGGVLALLIASQRQHTWFLERWANPVASAIVAVSGAVFLCMLLSGCAAPVAAEATIWQGVCFEEYLGKADNGMSVVRHYCVSEAAVQQ